MPEETELASAKPALWRRIWGKPHLTPLPPPPPVPVPVRHAEAHESKLAPRKVVTGLPRAQTFKRQQSEQRRHLSPITTSINERSANSANRRAHSSHESQLGLDSDASPPGLLPSSREHRRPLPVNQSADECSTDRLTVSMSVTERPDPLSTLPLPTDAQSVTSSQHEAMIDDELESTWILNLSMHFRDRSKREKFFVTYRERAQVWRRVTISLDYRYATPNSLEMDLINTRYQREKSAKIYEAIRESLLDIKFYDTVTNLKLETTNGRLHVHVVEDGNEVITYPRVSQVRHLGCSRIRERDIVFDSHMSGFVYKVRVQGQVLIKKEIPSQETVEEFLYEVNALNGLRFSRHVVTFYGVVVDDRDQHVKGLLISYASQGALIDIIYDHGKANSCSFPWASKEKWARQIVQGLADIHESGFVQGDFTLSNIVIDDAGDAKIIDINRRGCPVGWEPPEATALLETGHRISMYIGVKSDLYQLGMVLWGLAMEEDEPEALGRPLLLDPEAGVPDWYRQMTEICLSPDPRMRSQASTLLHFFPKDSSMGGQLYDEEHAISVDDGNSLSGYFVDGFHADGRPLIRTVEPPSDWPYSGRTYVDTSPVPYELYYPTRGRSPPSPLPSDLDLCEASRDPLSKTSWAANRSVRPSYTDVGADDAMTDAVSRQGETPTPMAGKAGADDDGQDSSRPEADAVADRGETVDGRGECTVAQGEDDCTSLATKAAESPGLIALMEEPKLAPGVAHAAMERSQATAASCTADAVRQDISREAEATGASGDVDDATQQRSRTSDDQEAQTTATMDAGPRPPTAQDQQGLRGSEAAEQEGESEYVAAQRSQAGSRSHDEGGEKRWARDDAKAWPPKHGPVCATGDAMRLPMSLTGVGAAHIGIDDEPMRERGILDDDFGAMVRPATVPALVTTEADR